jgi:hypothetical protein
MGFVAPLLLALLVLLSLRQSRRPLTSRTWGLLRSLLPSWRFFEDVEPGPELLYCVVQDGEDGAWQPALTPPAQRGLFLNAQGNLYLAQQSLVEQLWAELDGVETDAVSGLVSYRLVRRLVAERVPKDAHYRFKLVSGGSVDFESLEHGR